MDTEQAQYTGYRNETLYNSLTTRLICNPNKCVLQLTIIDL